MPALVIVLVVDTRAVVIVSVIDAGAVAIVFNVDTGAVVRGALIEGDAVAWDCVIARDTPPRLTKPASHSTSRAMVVLKQAQGSEGQAWPCASWAILWRSGMQAMPPLQCLPLPMLRPEAAVAAAR
ncbi:hypothetical protein EDB85DRAFT_1895971 [Lactarius pseudohatsudake]|nr:hypothetical protein EDB85DRAFT_1895971 [Lactarius pseudohatsudake]